MAAARSPVDAVIASRKIPLSAPIREGLGGGLAHSLPCQPPAHRSHPLAVEVFVEVDHTSPPQSQDVRSLVSVGLPVTRASPILPLHHYRGIPRETPHRHFFDLEVQLRKEQEESLEPATQAFPGVARTAECVVTGEDVKHRGGGLL